MRKHKSGIIRFVTFFVTISFVITCNIILFIKFSGFTEEQIRRAAPVTFGNVIFMAFIFYVVDKIRYNFSVKRPVKRISESIDKVMEGDFSVRIDKGAFLGDSRVYGVIIDDLNKLFEELGSVETLRTDFISSVSHELKTPMAAIQNYASLLKAPNITEEKRIEYGTKIMEQTKKLSLMVSNILRLNKLETQHIFPDMESINLSEHVCESILEFETLWEEKGIEIKTELDDDVCVKGDAEMLSLVWNNLMSNAVKFTEKGGSIKVAVHADKDGGIVQISDTGCGMSPETGKKIFQKFYQGDTSHASQGNGLGLALVKRIIDIHGGDISVSSSLGQGSTFTVKLPS